jgi:hypothetical protein
MISELERCIHAEEVKEEESRYAFAPELAWFNMFYNEIEPIERSNELAVAQYYVANLTAETCRLVERNAELQLKVIELERRLADQRQCNCRRNYTFNL